MWVLAEPIESGPCGPLVQSTQIRPFPFCHAHWIGFKRRPTRKCTRDRGRWTWRDFSSSFANFVSMASKFLSTAGRVIVVSVSCRYFGLRLYQVAFQRHAFGSNDPWKIRRWMVSGGRSKLRILKFVACVIPIAVAIGVLTTEPPYEISIIEV
jgi:hypothetical protein